MKTTHNFSLLKISNLDYIIYLTKAGYKQCCLYVSCIALHALELQS